MIRRVRAAALAVLLFLVGLFAGLPMALAEPAATPGVATLKAPTLVIVGAPGLAWSDLDRDDLPALAALMQDGALGSLTVRAVRSRSCAVDGWLTLSAGRRAADLPGPCQDPLPVVDGEVPRWAEYLDAAAADSYDAQPGTLGGAVAASGACLETVGPGAAIGGAQRRGTVAQHHADAVPDSFACPVVIVDGGVLPESGPERRAAVQRLDALVAEVLVAGQGADVVVAGVGDGNSPVRPRAVLASGPSFQGGVLSSGSTRQQGVVQLQDLTATALERVGVDGAVVSGRALTMTRVPGPAADLVADRVGFETRAATLRSVSPQVTGWLAVAFGLWAVTVAVLWWRRGSDTVLPGPLTVAGVAVATVPVATFVANLVPWWQMPAPALVFLAVLAVVVAAFTAGAVLAGRRHPLGALRRVAVVTVFVLAGDVLLGSRLQLGSVFGQNPVVGGRFYGFGNTSFALYGLAALVVVAWVAERASRSRRVSAVLALGVLVGFLAIEALPSLGADFGGPPALLLGGLVVIATAAGVRLTVGRVVLAVLLAGALVALVAWLDWLRPAGSRTHLGDFVETVLSGDAGAVIGRKVAQNVANLASPPLLAIAVATLVVVVVGWRTGWRPVFAGVVVLRGAVVLAVVGFAVNDSGLVIPAFVALVLAPLLIAAGGWPAAGAAPGPSAGPAASVLAAARSH